MARRVSSPRFVGRRPQLEELRRSFDDVGHGGVRLVVVRGEAGVGKSRLISAALGEQESTPMLVLRGGAAGPGAKELPYSPIVDALRDADVDMTGGAAADRTSLFERARDLVDGLSEPQPVVLVVEDLHWADRSSLDLLSFLLHGLARARVLMLVSLRTDERVGPASHWLGEVARSPVTTILDLERLDEGEVAELAAGIRGAPADRNLVHELVARSGGNPYLVEELLAGADLDGRPDGAPPPSVAELTRARLAELDASVRSLIEVVAVSGRDVSHHVLLRVTGLGDSELTAGMRVAVDSSLLTSGVSSTDVTYGFRHALAREVVYADLLPAQRRRLHARFGHGADRRTSDPVTRALVASEVAEHWWRSGDLPAALTSTVAAAEACRETYAFSEAALHGERAVALWPLVDPDDRPGGCTLPDLLDATTTAWITAGSPGRALTTARSAIEASDATSDPRRRAQRLARLGEAAMFAGDHATAAASLGAATVQLASEGPSVEKAEICALDAELLMLQSNVADACRRAAEAVELAIAAHARRVEGHAKNTWGAALSDVPGGLADATRLLEESLAIARAEGDRSEIDRVHTNLGVALEIAGRREEALALWLTGAAAAERHGSARGFGAEHVGNAIALLTGLGRWDEAEALADRVAPLEVGSVTTFGLTCAIALLRARQGRVIEARDLLTGAQPMLSGLAEVQHLCSFTEAWMEVDLATERPAEAVDAAERALDRLVGERLVAARALLAPVAARAEAELALALRAAAHHSEADAHARRAAEWADLLERESARYETHHERRELRLAATTASAEAARAAGRTLPRVWSDLATDWWRLGWPWQALVAQVRASEALLESGSRGSGTRNALRETLAAAQALGAEPLARRVRQLARQAGFEDVLDATTRPQASAGDLTSPHSESAAALERHGLTEREIQVLTLITEGRSNAQIAAELYISPSTAGVHVSHILSKLQVGNRVQAAAIGARLGLIGDHDASRGR